MKLEVGDTIKCHTSGYMMADKSARFATKGKIYKVTKIVCFHKDPIQTSGYKIIDDRGREHSFSIGYLKCGISPWFYIENKLITEKTENFFFNPRRILTEKTIDFFQGIVI